MKKIKIKEITCTCEAFPEQYEGKLENDMAIYIRERHGHFTVSLGRDLQAAALSEAIIEGEEAEFHETLKAIFEFPKGFALVGEVLS